MTEGCWASLSGASLHARHEAKRGGTALKAVQPMGTTRHPCPGMRRSRPPAKPALRATFLFHFRWHQSPSLLSVRAAWETWSSATPRPPPELSRLGRDLPVSSYRQPLLIRQARTAVSRNKAARAAAE